MVSFLIKCINTSRKFLPVICIFPGVTLHCVWYKQLKLLEPPTLHVLTEVRRIQKSSFLLLLLSYVWLHSLPLLNMYRRCNQQCMEYNILGICDWPDFVLVYFPLLCVLFHNCTVNLNDIIFNLSWSKMPKQFIIITIVTYKFSLQCTILLLSNRSSSYL